MTLATTSSAVISPFRMFTLAALDVLCAPASAAPISPDVMLLRKSDESAPATFIASPSASASAPSVPETAGSTASGDWALEPSGVLTYVLYAWPPTDWALPTAASPATSPTTSPRAARRFTQCMRSEERRVGKECRSRWSADHKKKKKIHQKRHEA